MPKNTVSDPITGQEMAYAHLIMSGNMTDRAAAEAVGLNPDTAAYTKAKPRVRDYMIEHSAAVREKLVDQEADRLHKLNTSRDQIRDRILNRLWELAALSHETTRGSIAGQMKALAMIAAIEGLIPDRRLSRATQPAAPPIEADIYPAAWLDKQQHQPAGEELGDPVAATAQPAAPPKPEPAPNPAPKPENDTSFPNLDQSQPAVANPFINPEKLSRVPAATNYFLDIALDRANSLRLPSSPGKRFSGRRR